MKKLPGLLLLILIALQPGCKKSNDTLAETSAHVIDGGSLAADGMGYHIHLDGTGEDVIPLNLPASYRQPGVNASVAIKFVDTGKREVFAFETANTIGLRVVYLVTLRKL
jgi:hypothetical protein